MPLIPSFCFVLSGCGFVLLIKKSPFMRRLSNRLQIPAVTPANLVFSRAEFREEYYPKEMKSLHIVDQLNKNEFGQ